MVIPESLVAYTARYSRILKTGDMGDKEKHKKGESSGKTHESKPESVSTQAPEACRDADFTRLDIEQRHQEELKALETKIQELEGALAQEKQLSGDAGDKYLRALAELENFKKRAMRERSEYLKYQGEPVLLDVLSVADNLDRAIQHLDCDPEQLREGLRLIHKLMLDILAKWEVKPFSGLGQDFDPTRFSAVSRVPAGDTKPGVIIGELKKAYLFKDRLLRPGEVVVSVEPPKAPETEPSDSSGAASQGAPDSSA